ESNMWRYSEGERLVEVLKWTGKNGYVALCMDGFLSCSGRGGTYGLYINKHLLKGFSTLCPPFDNPLLCSVKGGVKKG
ncbi:hypothetical protein L218DRAFT_847950, partial [Marasmius fiardii PR-910]